MNKRGGARKGAGRKKIYKDGRVLSFWVPSESVEAIKELVTKYLEQTLKPSESLLDKNPSESLPQKKDAHQSV